MVGREDLTDERTRLCFSSVGDRLNGFPLLGIRTFLNDGLQLAVAEVDCAGPGS